jgi:hypothetical protein
MRRTTFYNRLLRPEPAAAADAAASSASLPLNAPQLSPVLEEQASQLSSLAPSPVADNANAAEWLTGLSHQASSPAAAPAAGVAEPPPMDVVEDFGGFLEGGAEDDGAEAQQEDPRQDEWEEHELGEDAGAVEQERPGRRSRTRRFTKRRVRSPRPSANRPTTYANVVVQLSNNNDNNAGAPPRPSPRHAAAQAHRREPVRHDEEEEEKGGVVPMNIDGDEDEEKAAAVENVASNRTVVEPNNGQQPNMNNALGVQFEAQEAAAEVEEDWAVYCLRMHDTTEHWRTCIAAFRYATDNVSENLRKELASCNDPRFSLYPHNELRRHRNKLKCTDANWQFVCMVDGFKTARAAMRYMELSKKVCFHNRTRFYSLPDDIQARYGKGGRLLNEQGGPMLTAVREMTEALWLTLHPERNPNARGGLGRKPADVTAFQGADARLRWVWIDSTLCYAEPLEQLVGPLLHPLQLTVENWGREAGEVAAGEVAAAASAE